MTESQFQSRLIAQGASEREAELITAYVYPEWRSKPATKLTKQQWMDIRTLLYDRREEDQLNAWIDNEHINRMHMAGYVVRGVHFSAVADRPSET